ncbi:MAG TPA: plastocyanin/azurin family copper-binding protein [Solirubrobacteraceae bacterium]|nr:plastocyanin/azurin family copper-binding protein [Solirubrobacteraceae bacterium]
MPQRRAPAAGAQTARGRARRSVRPFTGRRAATALAACTALLLLSLALIQTRGPGTDAAPRPAERNPKGVTRQQSAVRRLGAPAVSDRPGKRVRGCASPSCGAVPVTTARVVGSGAAPSRRGLSHGVTHALRVCAPRQPRPDPLAGCSQPLRARRRDSKTPQQPALRPSPPVLPLSPSTASSPSSQGVNVPASPAPVSAPGPSEPSAPPPAPPSPARVQIIAREYSFTLSRPTIPAGEVIMEFVNRGQDPHNMHVLREAEESNEAGAFSNTEPDHHQDLTFVLRAGSYTLFCSLPGHRAAGMTGTLVVQ